MKRRVRHHRSTSARRNRATSRAGFTLLEMLVTAILSAVLLAGLWTLFNTYMRLFESGQAKTEQSQLVRALAQQIADDLRSIVAAAAAETPSPESSASNSLTVSMPPAGIVSPAPPVAGSAPATEPVVAAETANNRSNSAVDKLPRFKLVGTLHAMRLDALQPAPADAIPEESTTVLTNEEHVPPVPELRTIVYSFEEDREARDTDRKSPPGLLRVDIDWQRALEQSNMGRKNPGSVSAGSEAAISESLESLGLSSAATLDMLSDDAKMHVPEVVHCEFHYFDGSEWLEEWDSVERKSLPNAVEITLRLDPPPERWKPKLVEDPNAGGMPRTEKDAKAEQTEGLPLDGEPRKPVYRQIIALTSSPPKPHAAGFADSDSGLSSTSGRPAARSARRTAR